MRTWQPRVEPPLLLNDRRRRLCLGQVRRELGGRRCWGLRGRRLALEPLPGTDETNRVKIETCIATGTQISEVLGLKWTHVNLDAGASPLLHGGDLTGAQFVHTSPFNIVEILNKTRGYQHCKN